MIIQILLLTMGLDMTRLEFEPTTDVSGDYIVGTYDVSSDEFVVEELEEVPEEVAPSVDDSLSTSPVRGEVYLTTYVFEGYGFATADPAHIVRDASKSILYVPISVGYSYAFDSDAPRVWFTTSLMNDSLIFEVSSPYVPSDNGYLCVLSNRYLNVVSSSVSTPDDPSGNDPSGNNPSGGDFDDTNIVNALVDVNDTLLLVYDRLRSIGLYVLFAFAYPIALAIVKNIVGGDK